MGFSIGGFSLTDIFVDPFHGQSAREAGKSGLAIGLGQPGYFYEEHKQKKKDAANAAVASQKAAAIQAQNDAQDATNNSIIDAKRRRRASSLFTGQSLGGGETALGQGGSYDPAGAPAGTALGAGGGY